MHSIRFAIAVGAVAMTALASSEAYARDPDREIPLERPAAVAPAPPNYPEYALPDPAGPPADHVGMRVVQNGASALGGAGVACGAIWLYRRRTRLAV